MASRTGRDEGSHDDDVSGALDRLYATPFDDFVPRRREMIAALRAAGNVAGARVVSAATKPSRTAWALNQVARRRPELVKAAFDARARAVEAQTKGEGDALRTTARAYRDRLADLVQAASDAVREDGGELTVAQGRRISATVQAVAGADDAKAHEALLAGRLVADVDVDDPFAGLEVGPARERPAAAPPRDDLAVRRKAAEAARAREREQGRERGPQGGAHDLKKLEREKQELAHAQERQERARAQEKQLREREQERQARELEGARAHVAALEDEAREARTAARKAEVAAGRAQAEAQRLRRAVEAIEKRLSEAKGDLRSRSK